jgi:hypothetical protein
MRDLTDASGIDIASERSRVATEGWGRALLDRQAPEGWWGAPDEEGWMISMDALILLRETGVDPSSAPAREAISRVKTHLTWKRLGNRPYFDGETEPCINGAILAFGSYFGERCDRIVDRLLGEQLADGGWNCEALEACPQSNDLLYRGLRLRRRPFRLNPTPLRAPARAGTKRSHSP